MVRSQIARLMLGSDALAPHEAGSASIVVGDITLTPSQHRSLSRVTQLIARDGGALLADRTGTGKTYIALAVARAFVSGVAGEIAVVAPAVLRGHWLGAMERAGIPGVVRSLEAFSRSPPRSERPCFLIIDEAHHLRNPRTRRYRAIAAYGARARHLLLTATPVHNRIGDLVAPLALFLGDRARTGTPSTLARFVVRQSDKQSATTERALPVLRGPYRIGLPPIDDDVLAAIETLPPPVAVSDAGRASALVSMSLLRQWASSRAALVAGLRRRRARAVALLATIDAGRIPTQGDLSAWSGSDDSVQLAFAEIVADAVVGRDFAGDADIGVGDPDERRLLRAAIVRHDDAVTALLRRLKRAPDPDGLRIDAIRRIRRRHRDERILIFSQFADTVSACARALLAEGGVAMLTSRGARIASGRIPRGEVLAQFRPQAGRVPDALRIDTLLATDVLSEGLDLHAASVVIHLDLPWNPARVAQRLGRVRRLGSPHAEVTAYVMSAPAAAERVLAVEVRLRTKLHAATEIVGAPARDLIGIGVGASPLDPRPSEGSGRAEQLAELQAMLEGWRAAAAHGSSTSGPREDAARPLAVTCDGVEQDAELKGLAIVDDVGPTMIALRRADASDDVRDVLAALRRIDGLGSRAPLAFVSAESARPLAAIARAWQQDRRVHRHVDLRSPDGARLLRLLGARIASTMAESARTDRARYAFLLSRMTMAVSRLTAGEEAELAEILRAPERGPASVALLERFLGDVMDRPHGAGIRDAWRRDSQFEVSRAPEDGVHLIVIFQSPLSPPL